MDPWARNVADEIMATWLPKPKIPDKSNPPVCRVISGIEKRRDSSKPQSASWKEKPPPITPYGSPTGDFGLFSRKGSSAIPSHDHASGSERGKERSEHHHFWRGCPRDFVQRKSRTKKKIIKQALGLDDPCRGGNREGVADIRGREDPELPRCFDNSALVVLIPETRQG